LHVQPIPNPQLLPLLRNKMPTIKRHAIRSAIEMLVVTPVWCCIWVWIALILGLAWI
jgi:hypothetical protein